MTAYHALKLGGVTTGTKLGIIGAGGLGSLAIQFAVGLGADVYVAEIGFDEIGEGIERLQRGEVVGRLVAVLAG